MNTTIPGLLVYRSQDVQFRTWGRQPSVSHHLQFYAPASYTEAILGFFPSATALFMKFRPAESGSLSQKSKAVIHDRIIFVQSTSFPVATEEFCFLQSRSVCSMAATFLHQNNKRKNMKISDAHSRLYITVLQTCGSLTRVLTHYYPYHTAWICGIYRFHKHIHTLLN